MRKYTLLWLCLGSLLILNGCGSSDSPAHHDPQDDTQVIAEKTEDWATIPCGNGQYNIMNNVWNKASATGPYSQKIYLKKAGEKEIIGWQWDWPADLSGGKNVFAYPCVVCGDGIWGTGNGVTTRPDMPVQVGAKKITANFNVKLNATGPYNMAFDLWATSVLSGNEQTVTHEIMIWTTHQGLTPAGVKTDTIKIGKAYYDVYVKFNHTDGSGRYWTYIAFCAQTTVLRDTIDISAVLGYLVDEGLLTTNHYIGRIDLGNEIGGGKGSTEISDYSVDIE